MVGVNPVTGGHQAGEQGDLHHRQPLPVSEIVIHPSDGAMYFTIGGRRVQSGLYRVTYTGKESTASPTKAA